MLFSKRIKPIINNNIFRYSHHYSLYLQQLQSNSLNIPTTNIERNKFIINLFGDKKSVDTASWEINTFALEKSLNTANIVYEHEMLNYFITKNKFLQFIVNRCYNMSCENVLYLTHDIINTNKRWEPYNLYVMPNAKNRFVTCDFIQKCDKQNFIIYPLEASEENKRRDISLLIE